MLWRLKMLPYNSKMKRHEHENRNCIYGILTSFIRWRKWSAIYIAYDNKKLEAHRHCHLRLWLFKYWYLTRFFFLLFFSSLHISLNQKSLLMAYYCACIIQWWKTFSFFYYWERKKPINSPLDYDAATAAIAARWEYLCIHYWNKRQSSLS